MKRLSLFTLCLLLAGIMAVPPAHAEPRGQIVIPGGSRPSSTAPSQNFTGNVPFNDIETISPRPMLFIMGEKAHSRPFSEDAYARAAEPKELFIVKNAGHFDLYDKIDLIPFDKLEAFFRNNLK